MDSPRTPGLTSSLYDTAGLVHYLHCSSTSPPLVHPARGSACRRLSSPAGFNQSRDPKVVFSGRWCCSAPRLVRRCRRTLTVVERWPAWCPTLRRRCEAGRPPRVPAAANRGSCWRQRDKSQGAYAFAKRSESWGWGGGRGSHGLLPWLLLCVHCCQTKCLGGVTRGSPCLISHLPHPHFLHLLAVTIRSTFTLPLPCFLATSFASRPAIPRRAHTPRYAWPCTRTRWCC